MDKYFIQKLDLNSLSIQTLNDYYRLTTSTYHSYLHPSNNEEEIHIAIGALYQDIPVGIALAKFNTHEKSADFDFLYVDPNHREMGIGTQLVQELEKELLRLKCFIVGMLYMAEIPTTHQLEHLLKKLKWASPELYMYRYFFDVKKFKPRWLQNVPTLPKLFQKIPWKDLSDSDRNILFEQYEQGHFPTPIWPWLSEENSPHPSFSFALKTQEEIIGWLVIHQLSQDTLNYTALFVRPEFQNQGLSIRLLIDVIALQQQSSIPWAIFDVNLKQISASWNKFVKRRLAVNAQKTTMINRVWKILTP